MAGLCKLFYHLHAEPRSFQTNIFKIKIKETSLHLVISFNQLAQTLGKLIHPIQYGAFPPQQMKTDHHQSCKNMIFFRAT